MKLMQKMNWFLPWNDEKEEKWLQSMSRKGWHLKKIKTPSNLATSVSEVNEWAMANALGVLPLFMMPGIYLFEKAEPKEYVYRLDYFAKSEDLESYLQLLEDTGWEYLGKIRVWYYFRRKAEEGVFQELYSDSSSKAKKYQNNIISLGVISLAMVVGIMVSGGMFFPKVGPILSGGILVLYGYAATRLLMCIKKVKSR